MKDEIGEACGTYRERRNTFRLLTGKAEVKRTLGIPRNRWEYITKMRF
jgi:hypothetical protein